jgi:anaerobic ribonucleoside-triphosphate reductase activating protein
MRVARIWHKTESEGPGLRTAIWLQGCSIGCQGCINPHLWSFQGGKLVNVAQLADEILSLDVEGITLLGGEPFDQAASCYELARRVRDGGKGIITFSGYTYENLLREEKPEWMDLLSVTDMLVDGPYESELPEKNRAWVGSTNQRFLNLSTRYLGVDAGSVRNRIEMRVLPSGVVEVCGFASDQQLKEIAVSLSVKAKRVSRLA